MHRHGDRNLLNNCSTCARDEQEEDRNLDSELCNKKAIVVSTLLTKVQDKYCVYRRRQKKKKRKEVGGGGRTIVYIYVVKRMIHRIRIKIE